MLEGKRLLVSGVVNRRSIAYALAERAQREGADVVLTCFPRDRELAEEAAAALPVEPAVLDLDATSPADHDRVAERIESEWGHLDGALHAIAFAPRDALGGEFTDASPDGVNLAFQTSAFSLAHMARLLRGLAPDQGASLVGLDFDASRAWPVYDWMGVCKAALEATMRYLARDLGPQRLRVNLVAAGPLNTRAASGIAGFERLLEAWAHGAPLPWDPDDATPVATPSPSCCPISRGPSPARPCTSTAATAPWPRRCAPRPLRLAAPERSAPRLASRWRRPIKGACASPWRHRSL